MDTNMKKVGDLLLELEISPAEVQTGTNPEGQEENFFLITEPEDNLKDLYLHVGETALVVNHLVMPVVSTDIKYRAHLYGRLLELNLQLGHGAFVLTENKIFFHDKLELENLDLNELDASLKAASRVADDFGKELTGLYLEGK